MKYIIFDLDGTLSRTDKFMIPSIELAMEKMNIPVWTEDAIRCTIGEPVEVTNLKFFGQKKSEEADNFWKLVSGYYRTVFHNSVEEYEGVEICWILFMKEDIKQQYVQTPMKSI